MNKPPTPPNWSTTRWLCFGALCGFASPCWMFIGDCLSGNKFFDDWAVLKVVLFAVMGVLASIPGAAVGIGFSALPYKMPFALKLTLVAVLAQIPLYLFAGLMELV